MNFAIVYFFTKKKQRYCLQFAHISDILQKSRFLILSSVLSIFYKKNFTIYVFCWIFFLISYFFYSALIRFFDLKKQIIDFVVFFWNFVLHIFLFCPYFLPFNKHKKHKIYHFWEFFIWLFLFCHYLFDLTKNNKYKISKKKTKNQESYRDSPFWRRVSF